MFCISMYAFGKPFFNINRVLKRKNTFKFQHTLYNLKGSMITTHVLFLTRNLPVTASKFWALTHKYQCPQWWTCWIILVFVLVIMALVSTYLTHWECRRWAYWSLRRRIERADPQRAQLGRTDALSAPGSLTGANGRFEPSRRLCNGRSFVI